MERNSKEQESKKLALGISIGLSIGCGVGVAIGAATDNLGLWIAIGVGIGMGIGAIIGKKMDDNDKKGNWKRHINGYCVSRAGVQTWRFGQAKEGFIAGWPIRAPGPDWKQRDKSL